MSNVRVLETRRSQKADEIVDMLEKLVKRAPTGEFECVAVATVKPDGTTGRCWTTTDQAGRQLGAVAWLEHCIAQAMQETSGPVNDEAEE